MRTIWAWPAILLICCAVGAKAQTPDPREAEVAALVADMFRAADLAQWWNANQGRAPRSVTDLAVAMADRALVAQQAQRATTLYTFAALAYLHLGDKTAALEARTSETEVEFYLAKTPEEYRSVRAAALTLLKMAKEVKAADLEFRVAILAADCTFFAGRPTGEAVNGEWIAAVLSDIIVAFDLTPRSPAPVRIKQLATMTAETVTFAMDQLFQNQEEIEELLKKVAAGADATFPPELAFQEDNDDRMAIAVARVLASLSYRVGNAAAATARLAVAGERARKSGDPQTYLETVVERYEGERNAGKTVVQLRQLRSDALAVATQIRIRYRSRAGRIWNAYEFDKAYGRMLKDTLGDSSTPIADLFAEAESLKARTLLDFLSSPPKILATAELLSRDAALEQTVLGFAAGKQESEGIDLAEMRLISQLSGFADFGEGCADRPAALKEIEHLYESNGAGFQQVAQPASLGEIQAALAPGEAILEYVIPYHALHSASDLGILLITKTSALRAHLDLEKIIPSSSGSTVRIVRDCESPVDGSPLGDAVWGLRRAIRRTDEKSAAQKLQGFYELLIEPLTAQGFAPEKYSRLIIVPHGVLHYIPFAALTDANGVPLIRKTAISMAPSASVWLLLQKRKRDVTRWVGFGNPKFLSSELPTLESSVREIEQVSVLMARLDRRVVTGAEATKERFFTESPAASILHFSTHGEFPDDNAIDRHAVLLAGGDGALRAKDLRRADLTGTNLVVLSVCNGGLYRMGPTDEPYGLVPAFLLAGAENVMSTLWPLDDQFGRRFTVELYKHLLETGPDEAFRRACIHFIDDDELVRNWAGFVMVGPGRPFDVVGSGATK